MVLDFFDLLDPTPGAGHQFGQNVIILANSNIVVAEPVDNSVASRNGAFHLFNPATQSLVSSLYGDDIADQVGVVTPLGNGNYVVASARDFVSGVLNEVGSVTLIDGGTGAVIGAPITGDNAFDHIGNVTSLGNGAFVVASPDDDVGGIFNAGSVKVVVP